MSHGRDDILFHGNSNPDLAFDISTQLMWDVGEAEVSHFKDGETAVEILTHVREADTYIIQSTCAPANDNLMEILIMTDAIHRSAAHSITAVIPYFGYARADRRPDLRRVPITARLVADLLQSAGIKQVITCDLHCTQIQGFFSIPVINASSIPLFQADVWRRFPQSENLCIVSPDAGGVARSRALGKSLENPNLAIIDKRRQRANESEVMNVIGDIKGMDCVMFDDLVDTAGTLSHAATALKEQGAKSVHAYATHAVLSDNALERIRASEIDSLTITDTIPLDNTKPKNESLIEMAEWNQQKKKVRVLSIAQLLAETINRVASGNSVSDLFHYPV